MRAQSYFDETALSRFRLFFNDQEFKLVQHIESVGAPASSFISIHTGVRSKIGQENITSSKKIGATWKPALISGSEIGRYRLNYSGYYLNIDPDLLFSGGWDETIIGSEKLLIRQTGDSLIATLDANKYYHKNNLHSAILVDEEYDLKYLLAVINSKLMSSYYHLVSLELGRAMAQTDIETLEKLPIRRIDFSEPSEKNMNGKIIQLVDRMLTLNKSLEKAKTPQNKTAIQLQIDATDRQIDKLVYQLYGLTEDEIDTVENACILAY